MSKIILFVLMSVFLLGNSKCNEVPPGAPTPNWNPEIWAGSSKVQGIIRSKQVIPASSSKFNDFIATHKSEPRKAQAEMYRILNLCERWKSGASAQAVEQVYEAELQVIEIEPLQTEEEEFYVEEY